jgi:7-cyano-7-deazaguanine synthase in queuosine biosynthesis
MPGTLFFPFNHTKKSHTIDIMFQLGVEEISNLSHSCTETMTGRCKQCYHCKERAWAFEAMDKVDTGNG